MAVSPCARALVGAVTIVLAGLALGGCGLESKPDPGLGKPGDPAPAVRALRAYLDDDRCDLLSPKLAETVDPNPAQARKLCERGRIPVDALVEPGEYRIVDAELIDGEGVIRVSLKDGGIRDYTLVPGGPMGFLVDRMTAKTAATFGQPLLLQARQNDDAEPVDARITVLSMRRVPVRKLSPDEFTTSLDHYYLVRVRILSRSKLPQLLGSDGFQLATKEGFPIAEPREIYTAGLGTPLPGVLKPGAENEGDLFFASPRQVAPKMVRFLYGDNFIGATLTWTP